MFAGIEINDGFIAGLLDKSSSRESPLLFLILNKATFRGLCLLHSLVRLVLDRDYNPLDLRFIDPNIRRREPSVLALDPPAGNDPSTSGSRSYGIACLPKFGR
ncbi:hypothetical protein Ciccas_014209 [Cichlidogyrus casuarinus]|uniref:Uncharacterized protein n=1 Tax=Cichlidogyrus casuarinus TaxID=1844966 RepID=A0ABD2PNH6_9PLAT